MNELLFTFWNQKNEFFSNQVSLIESDGKAFFDKAKNTCFDWSNNCRDFFRRELVLFLKRNISPLKLQANFNPHAQIYFAAKLLVISPNRNPPLCRYFS